jgi:hypothetical protein
MPDSTTHDPNSTPRDETHEFGNPPGKKTKTTNLLKISEKGAAKSLQKKWDSQDPHFERRFAVWKVNMLRSMGYHNVALQKDGGTWDYYLPPNASPDSIPMLSVLNETNRKLAAIMFADPPASDVEPASDTDDEKFAAQIAKRVLQDVDSESMLSDVVKARRAFAKASNYGSGFVYYSVDPTGGPRVPIEIEAHPAATHVDNALTHPETKELLPPPYTKRFVMADGSLSERKKDAKLRPLPVLRSRVLTGRNVRFIPHNAEDLWDADGVMIGEFITWGRLRNSFPKLDTISDEERSSILSYRPKRAEDIAAWDQDLSLGSNDEQRDERLVWVLTAYYRQTTDYQKGAMIITLGNRKTLMRSTWEHTQEDGTIEVLDIPMTQYGQWGEGRDDPYYVGTTEIIGAADEFLASQFAMIVDHLDRVNNRKIFVDVHSIINEQDLYRRDKRIIKTSGDKPTYEEVPMVSRDVMAVFADVKQAIPNAVGLGETVTGLESSTVKSGRHALAVVQQAQASLSELQENIHRGWTRAGRVKLQLIRKFFKAPRQAGWTTEDDEYRLDSWIKPGTGTMMTPVAKAQLAEHYFTLGVLDQFRMFEVFEGNLGGTLGLEDDPVRLRIRRQISEWKNGPPEGWQPQEPQMQQDPMTGQTITVQPVDPILESIWQAVPADYLPQVASVRINELIRLMSTKKYSQKHQAWKARVEQEFQQLLMAMQPAVQGAGGATPEQANADGSPASQEQAMDQTGMSDSADSPGQRPSLSASELGGAV